MNKPLRILLTALVFILLAACSASPYDESTGEYLDSSTTTAKVKTTLLDRLGADSFAIKVKTYKDEVQLSGFVDTARIKQRAGQVAGQVIGVRNVRNDIIVKSR